MKDVVDSQHTCPSDGIRQASVLWIEESELSQEATSADILSVGDTNLQAPQPRELGAEQPIPVRKPEKMAEAPSGNKCAHNGAGRRKPLGGVHGEYRASCRTIYSRA